MGKLILGLIFIFYSSFSMANQDLDTEESFNKPITIYGVGSCGEFIRTAGENNRGEIIKFNYYTSWARGYVTGLNTALKNGGNVLGIEAASITDFMILVESYCRDNPMDSFINGISVPLHKLQPIDWEGKPYN